MPTLNRERLNYLPPKSNPHENRKQDHSFLHTARWTKTSKLKRKQTPYCEVHQHYNKIWNSRLVVDHVISRSQGGAELDDDNLMVMCDDCHNYKSGLEKHRGVLIEYKLNDNGDKVPVNREKIYELYGHYQRGEGA